jgi:hypothetical protein
MLCTIDQAQRRYQPRTPDSTIDISKDRDIFLIRKIGRPDQSFGPKNLDPQITTIQTAIKTPKGMINSISASLDHFLRL